MFISLSINKSSYFSYLFAEISWLKDNCIHMIRTNRLTTPKADSKIYYNIDKKMFNIVIYLGYFSHKIVFNKFIDLTKSNDQTFHIDNIKLSISGIYDLDSVSKPVIIKPQPKIIYMDNYCSQDDNKIYVYNPYNHMIIEEQMPSYTKNLLYFMHKTTEGELLVDNKLGAHLVQLLMNHNIKRFIKPLDISTLKSYIDDYNIDMSLFLNNEDIESYNKNRDKCLKKLIRKYPTLNDFFIRKFSNIKISRPINIQQYNNLISHNYIPLISMADSRVMVFPKIDNRLKLWIKGSENTIYDILENPTYVNDVEKSSMIIFRLAPQDYHRYVIPSDMIFIEKTDLDKCNENLYEYSVNPLAISSRTNVFKYNKKVVLKFRSKIDPELLFYIVLVGAIGVDTIETRAELIPERVYSCGTELGIFKFDGSTIILLTNKPIIFGEIFNKVSDLIDLGICSSNREHLLETYININEYIGKINKNSI